MSLLHALFCEPDKEWLQKAAEDDEAVDEQGHLRSLPWSYEARNRMFFDGSQQTALQLSSSEHAQRVAGRARRVAVLAVPAPAVPACVSAVYIQL